jgi:U5 small nuclear ribonucleoprotein component
MVQITKLYPSHDAQDFHAFGRVMSGTVRKGQQVKVLGQGYTPEDQEDMVVQRAENVWVYESR